MADYKGTSQAVDRREHDLAKESKRVELTDPFGGLITDGNFTTYVDVVDSQTTYVGIAQIGTATSDALWQISKVLKSGSITSQTWANGTDAFTQIWDNRASLSYS